MSHFKDTQERRVPSYSREGQNFCSVQAFN